MNDQENTTTEVLKIEDFLKAVNKEPEQAEENSNSLLEKLIPTIEPSNEEPETVEEEEQLTEPTNESQTQLVYNKVIDYIENGLIEDIEIEIGDGDDKKVVFLSDYKDIDEDTLKAVIQHYKKSKDEEIKERYISTEGLDERTKKMIELKKAGGDLSELIEVEVQYTNPLKDFNLELESDQERLVRLDLQSQNIKPKVIDAQIEAMKEDFTLDVEAKKIAENINKKVDEFIEAKKKEQLDAIEEEKKQQKEFKKNVNNILKEYNLPENISKVILENTTTTDEVGLTNTDKLYFDSKNDPELHTEISFFLNNREEFKKFLGVKVKNKATLEQVNKVLKINTKNIKTEVQPPATSEQKKEEELKNFFNRNNK